MRIFGIVRLALLICMAGIIFIGVYPQPLMKQASRATDSLNALNGLNAPARVAAQR